MYGITANTGQKMNPLLINFHEVRDAKTAHGQRQKLFYIFGNPIAVNQGKKRRVQQQSPQAKP